VNLPHGTSAFIAGCFLPFLPDLRWTADSFSASLLWAVIHHYFDPPVAGGAEVLNEQAHLFQYIDCSRKGITAAPYGPSGYLFAQNLLAMTPFRKGWRVCTLPDRISLSLNNARSAEIFFQS
jgi:hypothetical protein